MDFSPGEVGRLQQTAVVNKATTTRSINEGGEEINANDPRDSPIEYGLEVLSDDDEICCWIWKSSRMARLMSAETFL